MSEARRGLGIIFHSGSYDRLNHGLSIALAALALGRPVRLFFTYWALSYLRLQGGSSFQVDSEAVGQLPSLKEKIEDGHLEEVSELVTQTKVLGAQLYTCTHSMGLLNIARDELVDKVDRSMGLTTFLAETADDQILFI